MRSPTQAEAKQDSACIVIDVSQVTRVVLTHLKVTTRRGTSV